MRGRSRRQRLVLGQQRRGPAGNRQHGPDRQPRARGDPGRHQGHLGLRRPRAHMRDDIEGQGTVLGHRPIRTVGGIIFHHACGFFDRGRVQYRVRWLPDDDFKLRHRPRACRHEHQSGCAQLVFRDGYPRSDLAMGRYRHPHRVL